MQKKRILKNFRSVLWLVSGLAVVSLLALFFLAPRLEDKKQFIAAIPAAMRSADMPFLPRQDLAHILGRQRINSSALHAGFLPVQYKGKTYQAQLTLDLGLQQKVEELYERYRPVYAAFVAMDPNDGRVLAMADFSESGDTDNLALHASFPAASVFKVITSAAALEENKIEPQTMIAFNGSNTSLYKKNLREQFNRWTRYVSVEEALAKSMNTVFAKIAVNRLGPQTLQNYANRFGFNTNIAFDMPVDMSTVMVPEDTFGLAESGSGYTKRQTLSPLQGALIASSIVNNGNMPNPYLISEVSSASGDVIYKAELSTLRNPIEADTARKLARMMEATIEEGTARKEYRDYRRHPILSKLFIGAKTGSLSGENPAGKYDWFVGFAQSQKNPNQKIAFASMIVNRKFWRVKSSHIAREIILEHFKDKLSSQSTNAKAQKRHSRSERRSVRVARR